MPCVFHKRYRICRFENVDVFQRVQHREITVNGDNQGRARSKRTGNHFVVIDVI